MTTFINLDACYGCKYAWKLGSWLSRSIYWRYFRANRERFSPTLCLYSSSSLSALVNLAFSCAKYCWIKWMSTSFHHLGINKDDLLCGILVSGMASTLVRSFNGTRSSLSSLILLLCICVPGALHESENGRSNTNPTLSILTFNDANLFLLKFNTNTPLTAQKRLN